MVDILPVYACFSIYLCLFYHILLCEYFYGSCEFCIVIIVSLCVLAKKDCESCELLERELISLREDLVDTLNAWVVKAISSSMAKLYNPTKEPALVFFRHGVPLLYDGEMLIIFLVVICNQFFNSYRLYEILICSSYFNISTLLFRSC